MAGEHSALPQVGATGVDSQVSQAATAHHGHL